MEDEEVEAVNEEDEEFKFENKYLDPKLAKEHRKFTKEANRMMKLSLTDGLNKLEAIEYEKINNIDCFTLG